MTKPSRLGSVIANTAGTVSLMGTGKKNNPKATGTASYGNYVKIDHGNGVLGVYCGLNAKIPVKEGDKVTSKTQIGIVADIPSESVEQTHFHFEMYKDGIAVSHLKLQGMEG